MSLFKEILAEAAKKAKVEAEAAKVDTAVSEAQVEEAIENWKRLLKIQALLKKALDPVTEQIKSMEEFLVPVAKESYKGIKTVNNSILEYKGKSGTSVKYQQVVQKALEIATEEQRKTLEETIESVTTRTVGDAVKLLDPEIEAYLKDVKNLITGDDILEKLGDIEKLPRNIINKKKRDGLLAEAQLNEGVLVSVKKVIADIGRLLKLKASKLANRLTKFNQAADNFAAAVKSE